MTTLHLVGLPHTQTTRDVSVCAFTTKSIKFSRMMRALGYRTILYWGERNEAECDEHVPLFTEAEQRLWHGGEIHPNRLPGIATFDANKPEWQVMNARAIDAVRERFQQGDLLLILGGLAQKPITDTLGSNYLACEWAAGYSGWYLPYVCFESYAWMNNQYGKWGHPNGRFYDTVIPNFFDPDEWPIPSEKPGDYLVFVGRMNADKGPHIAAEIARAMGLPLKLAGSGVEEASDTKIVCTGGYEITGERMEYMGTVGGQERNELMAGALALICPTQYIEPFGAVAVEAQICGTPAIATDWGAFPETVPDGFRFRNLREGVEAVIRAQAVNRATLRKETLARYSLDAVGPRYDRWFKQLLDLYEGGWYAGTSLAAATLAA